MSTFSKYFLKAHILILLVDRSWVMDLSICKVLSSHVVATLWLPCGVQQSHGSVGLASWNCAPTSSESCTVPPYTYMEVGTDISALPMPITRLYYMCIHLHSIQIHVCVSTIHICSPCLANHDVEFWIPISTWFDLKTLLEAEYFGPVAAECQDLGTGRWGWRLKHGWLHL